MQLEVLNQLTALYVLYTVLIKCVCEELCHFFGTSDKASHLSVFLPQVTKVTQVEGDSSVRFSSETSFVVDKYEIL